ncbi:beta-ketoacyl synthase N-terminal-like domain-containing protein [Micromonospora sp. NPDC006766]|uniref:type I polyketide synthase n=1 Tax=Micromonospora sp. NPDC006766 TaxID=3154778 RepID=UPI0033EA7050
MDVAIVGMAALMPGAPTLEHYWRNLVAGVDAISDVPPNKWDKEFYDPPLAHRPDRLYCRRGGFVDDIATFDPLSFGVMPSSVPFIEPDQLIALEVAAAAIEDAGGADRLPDRDRVGVIVGRGGILSPAQARYAQRVRMSSQVLLVLKELMPELDDHRLELVRKLFDERLGPHQPEGTIGLVPNLTASRIANRFNLRGPAYTLDAACASSLIAVDQGATELLSGRLDMVLAGGVHHVHDISFWSVFSQLGALSRRGEIRPFDQAADGLLIGEGTGLVVLKRMADARRDGDRVYAAIRGIGTSSDGRSASMFNPASTGQSLAIRRAWQAAGLEPTAPDALGLLEAHGTGTPTGDAAELATLSDVFGPPQAHRPVVGSVKSMIGHTMPAAGIAGLIKAALAVSRGMLLPTLHCDDPLPQLAQTRFRTLSTAQTWEADGPRRAGVNAFGFGGINAHIILEEVPHMTTSTTAAPPVVREPDRLLLLSASDTEAMARLLETDDVLRHRPGIELGCRLAIVNPTPERLAIARKAVAAGKPWRGGWDVWYSPRPLLAEGKLAFVFPGLEAEFAPRLGEVAAHFGLPDRHWSMEDLGEHGAGVIEVGKTLDKALRRMGVRPDAVAGHSIGEWAAAAATGLMSTASMDEFLAVFNSESAEIPGRRFAFVGAGVDRVAPILANYSGVVVSHDNAPTQCCVNGPIEQVERLIDALRRDHVIAQMLPFRSAFHTPAFADGLAAVGTALRHWTVRQPSCPVWSATLAGPYPSGPDEVTALFARHMVEPVRFGPTVSAMYAAGVRVFLQVGAGQLSSVIAENLRGQDHLAMPVNVTHRDGVEQLRCVAAALWVEGGAPDFAALSDSQPTGMRLDLGGPLVRLGESANGLLGVTGRSHEATTLDKLAEKNALAAELAALLRETQDSAAEVLSIVALDEGRPAEHRETLQVSLDTMPYLKDHCFFVQPDDWPHPEDRWPVVPATTVVQLMMDAAERAAGSERRAVGVHDARFHRWVIAAPAQDVEIVVTAQDANRFTVMFGPFARATVEVAATYPNDAPPPIAYSSAAESAPTLSPADMYAERLMFHGPLFRGVTEVHALGERHVRGVVTTPTPPGALLDNALQLIGNWLITTQPSRTVALPVAIGKIRFFGPPPPAGKAFECIARVRSIDDAQLVADTQLIDNGRVWAVIEGAVDRRFDSHPTARMAERFPERYPMSSRAPEGYTMAFDCWTDPVTLTMAARAILGGRAYAEFDQLPGTERKRWLLGRIAAKDAVRFRQWDAGHRYVYPVELTIRDEPGGGHSVQVESSRLTPCFVDLAVCGDVGVAIAGEHPVGIAVAENPADREALAREVHAKAGGASGEIAFREVSNPDDLPARTYTVAFTGE